MDSFREAPRGAVPIRELGLHIEGTPLEPVIAEFKGELRAAGIVKLEPRFYLSTEWGVPFETIAIALPFYLAHADLAALHADRTGMIEGVDRADVLRYLRHEMGHVVSYAYRLYDRADWTARFGAITQPYVEEYRPEPWSAQFVTHLPGWYAQKHPDEDWAETFAVWMTPGVDWRAEYAGAPRALDKLLLCDALVREVREREPEVVDDELDEDVAEIEYTLDDFYRDAQPAELPPGLDGSLRAIFPGAGDLGASTVVAANRASLARAIYTWTGHFPERTRALLVALAARADELGLTCAAADEPRATIALTAFVTSLAMNHVLRGRYVP